jgi:Fe-S-cluster containining protein
MKDCNLCGKCCKHYSDGGLSASDSEIDWWEVNRPEIFRYVRDGKIWISPVTGKQLATCPWLRKLPDQEKYVCHIYADRPDDCKYYPVTIDQMVIDECEMLEARDVADPKRAQRILDNLMADSRPPVSK